MKEYNNPYLVGMGLGFVLFASFLLCGRGLGGSAFITRIAAYISHVFASGHIESSTYFGRYFAGGRNPLNYWLVYLGTGTFLGGFFFGVSLESGGLANCRKIAGVFYLRDATVVKVMFTAIITAMVLLFSASAIGVLDLSLLYVPATYIFSYIIAGCILGAGMVMGGY